MGKRTWIDSEFWNDTDDLANEDKLFYLYLLTNDQRNIAGYYRLNTKHMALDLGMTKIEVEEKLISERKYWIYDPDTKQILIPKYTRYNIVKSKQQCKKLNAELAGLKPCRLHKEFLEAFTKVNGIGADTLIDEKFKLSAEGYI